MVQHRWGNDESVVRSKCELILLYLGHRWYGEYISLETPEQDVLTLENLNTNKPAGNTKTTTNKSRRARSNKTSGSNAMDLFVGKRETRKQKCVNYADLNLGLDTSDDQSPPRKHKLSKAVAICEPSQVVIAARS